MAKYKVNVTVKNIQVEADGDMYHTVGILAKAFQAAAKRLELAPTAGITLQQLGISFTLTKVKD